MRKFLFCLFLFASFYANCQKYFLFIGSYTRTGSKGIYVYDFDAATGQVKFISNTEGIVNPSYLTISPDNKYVYACTETRTENAGNISSFSFNKEKGTLQFINKQPSGGDNPVYVAEHSSGKWVVCGNYTGGSLSAFRVNEDRSLQPASQVINQNEIEEAKDQNLKSHVHSTIFSPDHKNLIVPDLGLDKIFIYNFSAKSAIPLNPSLQKFATTATSAGPRHFVFHPNKKFGYASEELAGSVEVFKYKKGGLQSIQRLPTHPTEATGPFSSADIHITADGKFLYVSNRAKENNLAIFSVNSTNGKLTPLGYQPTLGEVPRNFIIEPTGRFVLVANQLSGNIVIFKRNPKTGLLTPTTEQIKVLEASCLQLMKQ